LNAYHYTISSNRPPHPATERGTRIHQEIARRLHDAWVTEELQGVFEDKCRRQYSMRYDFYHPARPLYSKTLRLRATLFALLHDER